jgi:hypothetical protein
VFGILIFCGLFPTPSFAQYMGNVDADSGNTGKNTLEEALEIQKSRVSEPDTPTNKILKLTSYENSIKVIVSPTTSVFDCGDLYITVFDIADDKKTAIKQGVFFEQCYGNSGTLPLDDKFSEKLDSGTYLIMAQLFDKDGDKLMTVSQNFVVQDKLVEFLDEPQITCSDGLIIENGVCILPKSKAQCGNETILHNGICVDKNLIIDPEPESAATFKITCGIGTHKEDGQCVPDKSHSNNIRNLKLQKGHGQNMILPLMSNQILQP